MLFRSNLEQVDPGLGGVAATAEKVKKTIPIERLMFRIFFTVLFCKHFANNLKRHEEKTGKFFEHGLPDYA